jgi:hypothetical protein
MIVTQSFEKFRDHLDELRKLGYGLSVYAEPGLHEKFDVENYKEMFIEWGWTGEKTKRPGRFVV